MKEKRKTTQKNGGKKMTLEKAMMLSSEEFAMLDEQYDGFNRETYNNHQTHNGEETFYDFIEKGSERIKDIHILKNID